MGLCCCGPCFGSCFDSGRNLSCCDAPFLAFTLLRNLLRDKTRKRSPAIPFLRLYRLGLRGRNCSDEGFSASGSLEEPAEKVDRKIFLSLPVQAG